MAISPLWLKGTVNSLKSLYKQGSISLVDAEEFNTAGDCHFKIYVRDTQRLNVYPNKRTVDFTMQQRATAADDHQVYNSFK